MKLHAMNSARAATWVLIGTFLGTLIFSAGKLIGSDIPVLQVVFFRYIGGFILLLMGIGFSNTGMRSSFVSARPNQHLMRAFLGSSSVVCSLYAASHMPLSDAGAINLTEGIFVVLIAATFLNERVSGSRWLGTAICLLGALVVMRAAGGDHKEETPRLLINVASWPAAAAFVGAFLEACDFVLIKTLSGSERAVTMMLYVNGLSALFLLIPTLVFWHALTAYQLSLLALLGPVAIAAQYCNVKGFRLAEASLLGPIHYSSVLFAGLIGYWSFGEHPRLASIMGSVLIIIGGFVVTNTPARTKTNQ